MNVLQSARYIVQPVFTLAVLVKLPRDGNGGELRRQQVARVLKREAHLCHTTATA